MAKVKFRILKHPLHLTCSVAVGESRRPIEVPICTAIIPMMNMIPPMTATVTSLPDRRRIFLWTMLRPSPASCVARFLTRIERTKEDVPETLSSKIKWSNVI